MGRKRSPGCASEPGNASPVSKFTLSREAISDLELIWEHIAEDNPVAAGGQCD